MKKLLFSFVMIVSMCIANWAAAAADLEVNTPAITALKASMQVRHGQLSAFYSSGAVGLTKDAFIAIKDATAVPLKDRGALNGLVSAENADRANLYKEIATANGHPEWQNDIQATFAGRWIDKAQSGWFYQSGGGWVKK
jgi:uncharacterized protein